MKAELPVGWILHRRDGLRLADSKMARRSTAIHEAAHAVVAEIVGARVQRVCLISDTVGFSEAAYTHRRGKVDPVARGVVSLAGHEAERRFYRRPRTLLPKGDYEAVLALGCSGDSANALAEIARRMVRWYTPEIKRVAKALLRGGSLNRRQFLAAYRRPS